jgi:hypothetical protein
MRRAVRGLEKLRDRVVELSMQHCPFGVVKVKRRQGKNLSEVAASKNRSAAEFQDSACLASLANRKRVGAEEREREREIC